LLETGTILGGYRVDGLLGEGGMGTVYRATQLSLERVVALKVLTGELSDDPGFRARFRREGQRQAAIDHPHIVSVYEAGETPDGLFLAMRLVEGPTLKALLLAGEIDHRRCLQVLTQVADALDAAHAVGLIHRDVKPQNILIGARDHAYLADFGLTKGSDEDALLTEPGHFVGTIDYISPEQARGEGASARSDVYSLCCVLHECLTGEVPFPRPSEPSVLFAHLTVPPPTPSDGHPELPGAVDAVIAKGMAKDPAARHPSAGALMLEARRAFAAIGPAPGSEQTRMHPVEPPGRGAPPPAGPTGPEGVTGAAAVAPASAGAARSPTRSLGPPAPGAAAAAPASPAGPTAAAAAAAGKPVLAAPVTGDPAAGDRRRPAGLAALALLVVVAAVAGLLVGGSGSGNGRAPAALVNSASAGPLELAFPAAWQRIQAQPQIPGLDLTNSLVLGPRAAAPGRLEAGVVAGAVGPTLLPAAFLARLPAAPAPGDPVRIGSLPALRYAGLRPRGGDGALTLYAVATSQGVLALACRSAPAAPAAFAADCARVVATAKLVGAAAYPPGPSPAYAGALAATVARLAAGRRGAEARLAAASTAAAQSAADRTLAAAYARAAGEVTAASGSPLVSQAGGRIAAALAALARAYARAGSAAAAGDAAGYRAAAGAVRRAGPEAAAAFAGLRALGYRVSG
jgi:hypothetical protein